MACARRDGEADGEPDRSLRHMLRAIAEERSRAGLRHDISGLGESGGAGGERHRRREPPQGAAAPARHRARFAVNNSTCCVLPARGRALLPSRAPGRLSGSSPALLSQTPLEKNGQKAPRTSAHIVFFKCKLRIVCFGMETEPIFDVSCQCSLLCGSQTLSRDSELDTSLLCLNDFTPLAMV